MLLLHVRRRDVRSLETTAFSGSALFFLAACLMRLARV